MTEEELKEIEARAKAATPGDLDTVPSPPTEYGGCEESNYYECPFCCGDGSVDGRTYTNFDRVAMGVQFFGIGDEFGRYESYFRTMSPSTTLALVEEVRRLREALGRIEEIAGMVDHVEFYTAESALGDLQAIRMIAVHSRHLPALGEAGRD
jgi:hypothetical protein